MCTKTALSLRGSRPLNMLVSMNTAESAGLLCCPGLAVTGQGHWNNTCHGILQLLDLFLPLYYLYIVPRKELK